MATHSEPAEAAAFEEVLAACIEALASGGSIALEELLERHPESAERLRARLGSLRELGLLADSTEAAERPVFGPYRVLRTLGVGGMGVVYLAEDARNGARVALKACRFAFGNDERARARFEREVGAAARLAHPSIVRVLDCGESDGRPFYTMEYVEGATLADVVSELRKLALPLEELAPEHVARAVARGLSEAERDALEAARFGRSYVEFVCRVALDVATGLAHAHEHGVVHRDVNPSNVLVRADGRALLFDLGLAQVANLPTLTRSGDFAGTPHYASPEQLAGSPDRIDARTDVYSLGATLYELLTLRRPFEGRSTPELADCIRTREPSPPRRSNPELPRDLETICLAALQKEPRSRYATMRAFADDVERFQSFQPIAARRSGPLKRVWRAAARRKARSTAIALAALVLVGAPIFLGWANDSIRAERDRADAAAREAVQRAEDQASVTEFLVEFFRLAEPDARGESVPVRELLERGVARLATGYADRPLVRAALLEAGGRIHENLGLARQALPLFDRALALRKSELGPEHPDTASVLAELAGVHLAVGNLADAEALAERALDVLDATPGCELAAARARRTLARCLAERGERARAESLFRSALDAYAKAGQGESETGIALREDLARVAFEEDRFELADERYEAALAARRGALGGDPRALAHTLEASASVLRALGRDAEAARREAEAAELAGRAPAVVATEAEAEGERALVPADFPARLLPVWRDEFEREFQAGITALQSGRHRDAAASFARCDALDPNQPVAAYNASCGWALAGELERAEEWLARAVDRGLGLDDERYEGMQRDPDLARLRARPAWQGLVARIEADRAAVRALVEHPELRRPAGETRGVLVALHDAGSSAKRAAERWSALAGELDLALVAPSAPLRCGARASDSMRWFEDAASFLEHPETASAPLLERLRAFLAEQGLEGLPVVLVGEGKGAPVAFDLALRAPGFARGALLVGGPAHPAFDADAARRARAARSRIYLVDDGGEGEALAQWLASRGIDARASIDAHDALRDLFGLD